MKRCLFEKMLIFSTWACFYVHIKTTLLYVMKYCTLIMNHILYWRRYLFASHIHLFNSFKVVYRVEGVKYLTSLLNVLNIPFSLLINSLLVVMLINSSSINTCKKDSCVLMFLECFRGIIIVIISVHSIKILFLFE